MTMITTHSVTGCNPNYSAQEQLLKEYKLSPESTLKVLFDSIQGVRGLFQTKGKTTAISFDDFEGIPKELKFNQIKLVSYLEETYVTLRRSEDQLMTIVFNSRLKGGGNKHSHHTQTYVYTPPPPPVITTVSYSAGFAIRSLFLVDQIGGSYLNAQGAPGGTTFSVQFSSYVGALPDVKIHVWKQDYYATKIAALTKTKADNEVAKAQEIAKLNAAEATKAKIISTLQALKAHQASVQAQEQARQKVDNEYVTVKQGLDAIIALRTNVANEIKVAGPDIRTTLELINMINDFAIPLFQPSHLPIHQFSAKYCLGNSLLAGTVSNLNSLLGTTFSALSKVKAETQKSAGKDIVALIGNTGTGKSTAVNYLLGIPMKSTANGQAVEVADGQSEIAKIGHHVARSETLYTQIYEKNNTPFVFADCGGFFDTRGASNDIAIVTSLKRSLENANSVKLVLCYDSRIVGNDRGKMFYETLSLSLKTLLKNYKEQGNSVMLMLTKPLIARDGKVFDSKDAIETITEIMNDLPEDSEQRELYRFLLRDNGKYICVCDPLSEANRVELHQLLNTMTAIKNTKEAFQVACSASTQLELLEEMTKISIKANELLNDYATHTARIAEEQAKYEKLIAELATIVKQKADAQALVAKDEEYLKANTIAGIDATIASITQQMNMYDLHVVRSQAELNLKNNSQILVYSSQGHGWTVTDLATGAAPAP